MGITIIQNENGFTYDKKKYKYGESLIEFVTQDFSELKSFISQDISSCSVRYEEAFNYLFNSFKKFKHCNNSIHFKLMLDTLINYYNQAEEIDDYDKPFLYTETHLDEFMNNISLFFWQLFYCRNHIKEVIQAIDYNSSKKTTLINRLQSFESSDIDNHTDTSNQFITPSKEKHVFIPIPKSRPSLFDYCEEVSQTKLVFNKDHINYELFFSTVEEFCNFELKAIIEKQIPIAVCPYKVCKKPFIKKHNNQKYCSNNCKIQYLNSQHNNFYNLYRKRSRYLNNKYNSALNDLLPEDFPSEKLKKLYDEYKDFDDTDEELIKEFDSMLHKIN